MQVTRPVTVNALYRLSFAGKRDGARQGRLLQPPATRSATPQVKVVVMFTS